MPHLAPLNWIMSISILWFFIFSVKMFLSMTSIQSLSIQLKSTYKTPTSWSWL